MKIKDNLERKVGAGQGDALDSATVEQGRPPAASSESVLAEVASAEDLGRVAEKRQGGPAKYHPTDGGSAINFVSGPLALTGRPIDRPTVSCVALARAALGPDPVRLALSEIGAGQVLSDAFSQLLSEDKARLQSLQSPYDRGASDDRYGAAPQTADAYVSYDRIVRQLDREHRVLGSERGKAALIVTNSAITDRRGGVAVVGIRWVAVDGTTRSLVGRVRMNAARVRYQKQDLAAMCLHWSRLLREGASFDSFRQSCPEVFDNTIEFLEFTDGARAPVRIGVPHLDIPADLGRRPAGLRETLEPARGLSPVEDKILWLNQHSGARFVVTEVGLPFLGLSQRMTRLPFCALYSLAGYAREDLWRQDREIHGTSDDVRDILTLVQLAQVEGMNVDENRGRGSITIRSSTRDGQVFIQASVVFKNPHRRAASVLLERRVAEGDKGATEEALEAIVDAVTDLIEK